MNLVHLTDPAQLETIARLSSDAAVVIFKHSSRCGTSSMAWSRLERQWSESLSGIPVFFLDILDHRSLSNLAAERFGITHESPQLLLIRDGKCIYSSSHNAICAADVEMLIRKK